MEISKGLCWAVLLGGVAICLISGCSLPISIDKDLKEREVSSLASRAGEIEAHIEDLQSQLVGATASGNEVERVRIEAALSSFRAMSETVSADLAVAQDQHRQLALEERRQRQESAGGWLKLALGVFTTLIGGSGLGSIVAGLKGLTDAA